MGKSQQFLLHTFIEFYLLQKVFYVYVKGIQKDNLCKGTIPKCQTSDFNHGINT